MPAIPYTKHTRGPCSSSTRRSTDSSTSRPTTAEPADRQSMGAIVDLRGRGRQAVRDRRRLGQHLEPADRDVHQGPDSRPPAPTGPRPGRRPTPHHSRTCRRRRTHRSTRSANQTFDTRPGTAANAGATSSHWFRYSASVMPSSEKLITRISTSCLQVRGDTPPPSPQLELATTHPDEDNMMIVLTGRKAARSGGSATGRRVRKTSHKFRHAVVDATTATAQLGDIVDPILAPEKGQQPSAYPTAEHTRSNVASST